MYSRAARKKPLLITFSGVDGSGKSTQIENLRSLIHSLGLTSEQRTFWDDVVVMSRYRERFVQKVLKSESGVGSPDKPVSRRDKNVRSWYLNLFRHGLYLLDAWRLPSAVAAAGKTCPDVIIIDRYIYDELANLPLDRAATRAYVKLIARFIPRPDIAFVLDADPEAARARKPEYPVDFLSENRIAYLKLSMLLGNLTVVPATTLPEAKHLVEIAFARASAVRDHACDIQRAGRTKTVTAI